MSGRLTRRRFVSRAAASAAATLVADRVLGGAKHVPPSRQIQVAYIGCGSQGLRQLMPALERPEIRIAAVCDPNRRGDNYPQWGPQELNRKLQKFLGDPQWAAHAPGALCGREIGQEVVNRHYARAKKSGQSRDCRAYADFRELLAKERDLDALYIMTPDHLHGVIAVHALRLGKHVVTHKPLANVLAETRLARDTARQTGAATHMFCASDNQSTPRIQEWLDTGVIGAVREVHNWSSRPVWPQGMTHLPSDTPPVPEGFDWDLWQGPVPPRPYHPAYTHAVFRGWFDYGSGALGDMGHYSFFQIFRILGLGSPTSVEASRSQFWSIQDYRWQKEVNTVSYPAASTIHWEFPGRQGRPPVSLHWYDGGMRPEMPVELKREGGQLAAEGMLLVGEKGKILAGFMGDQPRLIPSQRMREFQTPAESHPRPQSELEQWIRACQGGAPSSASFDSVYPFAETIQLGNVALRTEKRLLWDGQAMAFTNAPEMNQYLVRKYRPGWEL